MAEPMNSRDPSNTKSLPEEMQYSAHSLVHKAIVRMDPTLLEKVEGFEKMKSGYKFTPEDSNVRVILSGRDWSEKRLFIYGSQSTEDARKYVDTIIEKVRGIGHECELITPIEITNIAVNGEFGTQLNLGFLFEHLEGRVPEVEYEPEQFPALIVKLTEPQVTFLLFSTGRFAIQGLNTFEDIRPSIQRMWSMTQGGGI